VCAPARRATAGQGEPPRTRLLAGFFSALRRHFDYAALVTQGSGDTETPPARGQAPSEPSLDRPTPIVDISREVEASRHNTRETARLRTSQITRLVDQTRAEVKAEIEKAAPARAAAPEAAPTGPAAPLPPPRPRRLGLPLALGALVVLGAVVLAYTRTHRPQTPPPAPSMGVEPTPAPTPAPTPTPTLAATAAPSAAAPPVAAPPAPAADEQARQALERLRTGLASCIRNRSHTLPSSSPAVPPSLVNLKEGPYTPSPGDWKPYAWACAQFQMSEPMNFQIQWQLIKSNAEGVALAWIDQDHDGVADRVLGLSVKLDSKGKLALGEIQPMPVTTPSTAARR
jgi:hypothetical protein